MLRRLKSGVEEDVVVIVEEGLVEGVVEEVTEVAGEEGVGLEEGEEVEETLEETDAVAVVVAEIGLDHQGEDHHPVVVVEVVEVIRKAIGCVQSVTIVTLPEGQNVIVVKPLELMEEVAAAVVAAAVALEVVVIMTDEVEATETEVATEIVTEVEIEGMIGVVVVTGAEVVVETTSGMGIGLVRAVGLITLRGGVIVLNAMKGSKSEIKYANYIF